MQNPNTEGKFCSYQVTFDYHQFRMTAVKKNTPWVIYLKDYLLLNNSSIACVKQKYAFSRREAKAFSQLYICHL